MRKLSAGDLADQVSSRYDLPEITTVGYAIPSWQLGTLHILLQHGCVLSEEEKQRIRRMSHNDQQLLDELLAIRYVRSRGQNRRRKADEPNMRNFRFNIVSILAPLCLSGLASLHCDKRMTSGTVRFSP